MQRLKASLFETPPDKRRWFSGRMLACHAGGPGSIPGRRSAMNGQMFFIFFKITKIHIFLTNDLLLYSLIHDSLSSVVSLVFLVNSVLIQSMGLHRDQWSPTTTILESASSEFSSRGKADTFSIDDNKHEKNWPMLSHTCSHTLGWGAWTQRSIQHRSFQLGMEKYHARKESLVLGQFRFCLGFALSVLATVETSCRVPSGGLLATRRSSRLDSVRMILHCFYKLFDGEHCLSGEEKKKSSNRIQIE